MNNFFCNIYSYLSKRKRLFYLLLIVPIILMVIAISKIKFTEDITSFFPVDKEKTSVIFKNLKVKDKIIFIINTPVKDGEYDIYEAIDSAENFLDSLSKKVDVGSYAEITSSIDYQLIDRTGSFIYKNLPILLSDEYLDNLDSLTQPSVIKQAMVQNYNYIISGAGGFMEDFIYKDPLKISTHLYSSLEQMNEGANYKMIDSYIFSNDSSALFVFAQLCNTSNQSDFIEIIESTLKGFNNIEYFGAPAVAYYNAKQIKRDTLITLNIAIAIVVLLISLTFKNKRNIILIIFPALYGGLFALSSISIIQGEISSIAAGAGAVIFGIALSYSIHFISHANHCTSIKQIISELSEPLTIGSFTTIGGFAGLLFTTSPLLRDFGLFASLSLIGTTIFTLIFLPHFIKISNYNKENYFLKIVEKFTSYKWEKNKILVASLLIVTLICLFFYHKVEFNGDMMALNYEPLHLKNSREKLERLSNQEENEFKGIFIAYSKDINESAIAYNKLCKNLDSLKKIDKIESYASINNYVIDKDLQCERIDKWNNFWSEDKKTNVIKLIDKEKEALGFEQTAFNQFNSVLNAAYSTTDYKDSVTNQIFGDWINSTNDAPLFICHATINCKDKEEIYKIIEGIPNIIIADRAYYASTMAELVNEDFYLILYICSFLIFFALLISYGRLELTLISFLPMFISWIIILGLMAIFKIEFNIVNIILSTFIFGIGDDFSIFIMDGLLTEYKSGKKLLNSHKTAIFFSAFAILIGMGALFFAKHPAIKSLAFISVFGIITVVLVSYTLQPIIFNLLVTSQTKRKGFPYTIMSILNTFYAFNLFVLGCSLVQAYITTLFLIPVKKERRQRWVHRFIQVSLKIFIKIMITVKWVRINQHQEKFKKPSIIIANHQSFIDILMLLALHPKLLMVTNNWVWNSPFFGRIVRYLGFYNTINGYENLAKSLKDQISKGYSIIVFPEGTRSADCSIKRFHKGAFYLAELLNLDIIPILIYGNGMISSKTQPFYIKKGIIVSKILPRISINNNEFGRSYTVRTKSINKYFREEYTNLCNEYNAPFNKYFYDALIKNYIYKGPVLEWYMRIKVKMENNYKIFNDIIPKSCTIVDIGCGYGPLSLMLSLYSNKRNIVGIDYDSTKIETANHLFSKTDNLKFKVGDIRTEEFINADVYIMNDVLHYIDRDSQINVIKRCICKLNPNGKIIIRDGDSNKKEHKNTKITELLSTKIFRFNKTTCDLSFFNSALIEQIASEYNMSIIKVSNDNITSNTIYILSNGK